VITIAGSVTSTITGNARASLRTSSRWRRTGKKNSKTPLPQKKGSHMAG
jgi:hypothetical protein